MSAIHPPQYELLKSRITPSTSKYWAVVHIPPANPNQDPTEVSFVGKSMPTPHMAIEAAAYEALTHLRFAVPMPASEDIITFRVVQHPEKLHLFPVGALREIQYWPTLPSMLSLRNV